ncbi:hypothetical protein RJZ56_005761 [Blastomyces dermatitidis]|uniref:Integral membrane protein n=1 Tax=Ajellomyces dermatitidis (strain ER-3 / ATCC MYA-2586) TaxID=559297 RepID=A0ABP2F3T8_AJEDR|nr:uncharacterized protein BDCG_06411 [Blastomyces dermatitidis ER-3]EEQ91291.1 integral membrane protein [Blastomyces dermatitidis ER-3]EQL31204.1 hypothetical protein BDFG_06439 [Blastomyces dermatitidis ATCC 26199]
MPAVELLRREEPAPRIISPLPAENRGGVISFFACSLLSVLTTGPLVVWLAYRLIFWRWYYTRYPGRNQLIILVFNLLIADLHQASANLVSPYWLLRNEISIYSPACFAQGWLINFGDIASGMFVLAIAIHTFAGVVWRKMLSHVVFVGCVVGLWMFCLLVTALAPALHGRHVFVPIGAWCWIDSEYGDQRLYLHYFWIFVTEIGIIIIYPTLFFIIRHRLKSSKEFRVNGSRRPKFNKVLKIMIIYPIAYIVISLPIAAGRMSMMNGRHPGMPYFYFTGSLLMCSGWVHSILYFLTRRRLVEADIQTESGSDSSNRPNPSCDPRYEIPLTIGGGGLRGTGSRHKPSPAVLKNSRTLHTISSSTDNILDTVELSELGEANQMGVVEISSEPTRVTSYSSTSSSNGQLAQFSSNSAPSISTPATSTQRNTSMDWPTQYQGGWAS